MALPVNGSTHLIPALLLIYRPRKDEKLSWPSWLTCSGWFSHISGHPSAAGRAQDRDSSPARDRRSTTVPCHQPIPGLIFTNVTGNESVPKIIINDTIKSFSCTATSILVISNYSSFRVLFGKVVSVYFFAKIH